MTTSVFVSYDHDDQDQVNGFRGLNSNPNHQLDFRDHSLVDAITGPTGKPLGYAPTDPRSKPVRDAIIKKFERASKLVVLIGPATHLSAWVKWEVDTFFQMKQPLSAANTWRRIRGMTLKGHDAAKTPPALAGQSTQAMKWDPVALDQWLDLDPNKSA